MKTRFTVLGGGGFIGRRLVAHLRARGFEVEVPPKDAALLRGRHLGNIIYAIGLTGNFRTRPYDTVKAHVDVLGEVLQTTSYDSLLYLSSTRIYGCIQDKEAVTETDSINVRPSADAVYDLSKMLGESLCLATGLPAVRIARLSNVYGPDFSSNTFLGAVLHDLAHQGKVTLREGPDSAKDYISLEDVVPLLEKISLGGEHPIYNVCSGRSTAHRELAELLRQSGYPVDFFSATTRSFPRIDNTRIVKEFDFSPRSLLDDMPRLLAALKKHCYES